MRAANKHARMRQRVLIYVPVQGIGAGRWPTATGLVNPADVELIADFLRLEPLQPFDQIRQLALAVGVGVLGTGRLDELVSLRLGFTGNANDGQSLIAELRVKLVEVRN